MCIIHQTTQVCYGSLIWTAVIQEASSTKAVCLMDPGKAVELNISDLLVTCFTVVALRHVTYLTTVHCFC
jgi:hypothetical protein